MSLSKQEKRIRQKLKDDFPHYSNKCLKIRTKEGSVIPFGLNEVQQYVHKRLELQLSKTGRIRALILKGRQNGISTYIQGRNYWKVTHRRGVRAYILTHEDDATSAIFGMVDRFYEHSPKLVKPHAAHSNAKELYFDGLDSGYGVGTAKTKAKGRSQTNQYFHGSEVAFWANAQDHMAGVLQTVPDMDGTEIIFETTGNGPVGLFHDLWIGAIAGENEYEAIFIPWHWHTEYQTDPGDWKAPPDFVIYGDLHELTPEQLFWAYRKNAILATALRLDVDEICWQFRQEYPATADEAFQTADTDSYIRAEPIIRASQFKAPKQTAPLVFGVDVSGGINDKTWIIDRKGRKAGSIVNEKFKETDQMVISGHLAKLIDKHKPVKVFIDVGGGYGSGVLDRLRELGYGRIVTGIQFGAKPSNSLDYANKRAEMWGEMRDWLLDSGGAEIPSDQELIGHILAPGFKINSNDQVVLEKKEDIKKRLGISPDGGDALALTFAQPVRGNKPLPIADNTPEFLTF